MEHLILTKEIDEREIPWALLSSIIPPRIPTGPHLPPLFDCSLICVPTSK